jgi:hypothetical protein
MGTKVAFIGWLVARTVMLPASALAQGGVVSQSLIPDARSQAMGRAFTAVAEGPAANWWNPGALGLNRSMSFQPYSAVQLVPGLADDVWLHAYGATVQAPSRGLGFGVHVNHVSYGKRVFTDFNGDVIGEAEPRDYVILIGFGSTLAGSIAEDSERFRWGVGTNFKIFDADFGPTSSGQSIEGNSWDIDVGTLLAYRLPLGEQVLSPHLNFRSGLVVLNLLDRGITFDAFDESDPLLRRLRIGGAIELNVPPVPPVDRFDHLMRMIIAADQLSFHGGDSEYDAERYYGMEMSVMSLIAIRTGRTISPDSDDFSSSFWGWGVGTDLRVGDLSRIGGRVDFASVPQSYEFPRLKQYTVSCWFTF